jgi:hypothetical protein
MGSLLLGNLRVDWLGLTLVRREIPPEKRKREIAAKEEKGPRSRWSSVTISRLRESLPYLPRLLRTFLRSLSAERFSCNVAIGLDDPADTAVVSGVLWSLGSMINASPRAYLSVEPDFREERLDGYVIAELRVRLVWIALATVSALTKRPVRQLLLGMRG